MEFVAYAHILHIGFALNWAIFGPLSIKFDKQNQYTNSYK